MMHGIAFLTLYFFVISTSKGETWQNQIKHSVILYIWFLLLTKCNPYITIIILILFCGLRFVSNHKEIFDSEKQYQDTKKYLNLFCVILTIVGVIMYYSAKKGEYKSKFDILHFFIGTPPCKSIK